MAHAAHGRLTLHPAQPGDQALSADRVSAATARTHRCCKTDHDDQVKPVILKLANNDAAAAHRL